jgi:hypothetical protein
MQMAPYRERLSESPRQAAAPDTVRHQKTDFRLLPMGTPDLASGETFMLAAQFHRYSPAGNQSEIVARIPKILLMLLISYSFSLLVACGQADLSRSAASALIDQSPQINGLKSSIPLRSEAYGDAEAQGVIINGTLTPEALREITQFENSIVPNTPAAVSVEVTGIQMIGEGDSKAAQALFTWTYTEMPPLATRFAVRGGSGEADFALFDDGWRLNSVTIQLAPEGMALSESESARMNADVAKQNKILVDRNALVEQSKTPSKIIQAVSYAEGSDRRIQNVIISDVNVRYLDQIGQNKTIWFGDITGFRADPGAAQLGQYSIRTDGPKSSKMIIDAVSKALDDWNIKYAATKN